MLWKNRWIISLPPSLHLPLPPPCFPASPLPPPLLSYPISFFSKVNLIDRLRTSLNDCKNKVHGQIIFPAGMLCLKYSVFMACTVYFIFRDVGTWEPFAENIFASTIDIIQEQRVEVQQAAFLKPDVQSFLLLLLASTFTRKERWKLCKVMKR